MINKQLSNSAVENINLLGELNFNNAIRFARENHMTIEFTPKAVIATKYRVSECVKYSSCKNLDEATILAIESCLSRFNNLIKAH